MMETNQPPPHALSGTAVTYSRSKQDPAPWTPVRVHPSRAKSSSAIHRMCTSQIAPCYTRTPDWLSRRIQNYETMFRRGKRVQVPDLIGQHVVVLRRDYLNQAGLLLRINLNESDWPRAKLRRAAKTLPRIRNRDYPGPAVIRQAPAPNTWVPIGTVMSVDVG